MLRFLRLILMSVTLLVAAAAQLIFDFGALSLPLPPGLAQQLPGLVQLAAWRAGELNQLAFWAALSAGLLFGLVAPGWPVWPQTATGEAGSHAAWPVMLAAGASGAAVVVAVALAAGAPETGWMHWLWLGSAALLVAAAAWATLPAHAQRPRQPLTGQGWILLLLALLAVTALLVGWGGTALPISVDRATARSGLAAANLLADPGAGFFTASRVGMPGIAHAPLALLLWLFQDGLTALHLLAGLAALLLVGGVWLLASELFRRPDEAPGALALLAAGLTAVALPTLHFGRTTPTLLATSVAVMAGWLLLRGLRRANALAFAASGMLAGAAALLDRSAFAAPVILALWWLGAAILRTGGAPPVRWGQFWWWLAGLTVAVGPVVGVWLHSPGDFTAYARGLHLAADFAPIWPTIDVWGNLRNSFLGLMWLPDASTTVAFPGHFVHSLVAPLLWLAAGALLVNLDRFVGWALMAWLLPPLLLASVTTAATPDWTQMVLLLPGVSLALAFVCSRFYAAWRAPDSGWPDAPAAYVLAGLLAALAFNGAVAYYTFAATSSDVTSYVGRAVRAAAPQPAVLVASDEYAIPSPADEIVQFLTLPGPAPTLFDATLLPAILPPGSQVLLLPSDAAALQAVRTRYPDGVLTVTRDLRATPRLLVYRLP